MPMKMAMVMSAPSVSKIITKLEISTALGSVPRVPETVVTPFSVFTVTASRRLLRCPRKDVSGRNTSIVCREKRCP